MRSSFCANIDRSLARCARKLKFIVFGKDKLFLGASGSTFVEPCLTLRSSSSCCQALHNKFIDNEFDNKLFELTPNIVDKEIVHILLALGVKDKIDLVKVEDILEEIAELIKYQHKLKEFDLLQATTEDHLVCNGVMHAVVLQSRPL